MNILGIINPNPLIFNLNIRTRHTKLDTNKSSDLLGDSLQIEKELGWAEELGMNTLRVYLHDLVWDLECTDNPIKL